MVWNRGEASPKKLPVDRNACTDNSLLLSGRFSNNLTDWSPGYRDGASPLVREEHVVWLVLSEYNERVRGPT
jgi:hypothetical protein